MKTINAIYFDDYKPTTKTRQFSGDLDQVFEELYKLNNSLRYCNGSYWRFDEQEMRTQYSNWMKSLSKTRRFNLYYGNGIVD